SDEQARLAADPAYIRNLLAKVRADGYGVNAGEWNHDLEKGKIGAIAVPILQDGHAVACLSVIYLLKAVRMEDAVTLYLPALREATAKIERLYIINGGHRHSLDLFLRRNTFNGSN